jgi:hypothetical protein
MHLTMWRRLTELKGICLTSLSRRCLAFLKLCTVSSIKQSGIGCVSPTKHLLPKQPDAHDTEDRIDQLALWGGDEVPVFGLLTDTRFSRCSLQTTNPSACRLWSLFSNCRVKKGYPSSLSLQLYCPGCLCIIWLLFYFS